MKVFLKGMEFFAYHGVNKEEKILGQRFKVDVEFYVDEVRGDNIDDTVSYSYVYKLVREIVEEKNFNLMESLAKEIGDKILAIDKVKEVVVRVSKVSPPIDGILKEAGVEYRKKK